MNYKVDSKKLQSFFDLFRLMYQSETEIHTYLKKLRTSVLKKNKIIERLFT